jgi:cold shock CspA family protein
MITGRVAWSHPAAGFGLVTPDGRNYNVYAPLLRFTDVNSPTPQVGQHVGFDLEERDGGQVAVNLQPISE